MKPSSGAPRTPNGGRPARDRSLREIARLLRENVRDIDIVARIGPERFAMLLPGTDGERALAVCERLQRMMGQHGGLPLVRIGVCDDLSLEDPEMMIGAAAAQVANV